MGRIDIGDVIERVLGNRTIVRQAHGETLRFGAIEITATPFVGEFPKALPHAWNCYVVHGADSSIVLCNGSAIIPENADAIAVALRDRGRGAVMFAYDAYAGDVMMFNGFREGPQILYPSLRTWPWFLPIHKLFEPNPRVGVSSAVLKALGDRTGLRRFFTYEAGGAPWLAFQLPHVHRHSLYNLPKRVLDQQRAVLNKIGFEVPEIRIGMPFTPSQW